jgi:preprotein translocase subunit SecA
MSIIKKIFGSNEREVSRLKPIIQKINGFGEILKKLSNEELRQKTEEFKDRLKKGDKLDFILPEAFAVVREAADRVIGERHFDVQLIGGIVLHQGKIAEMKTGEGKTLASTLAAYLNALSGNGVHIVTVNDYLARRDCNWMGAIFHFLGITTACIMHDESYRYEPAIIDSDEVSIEKQNLIPISRRDAYHSDITYGTNNEFGFDYLRDNMVQNIDQMGQRKLNYAIVDEVDSILIDEARTPLIISAPDTESGKLYLQFASLVKRLKDKDDYEVEEKTKSVTITEKGIAKIEEWLGVGNLYETGKIKYVHHLEQALKAEVIFSRDRDYVVKDGEVIIVDDFTGRLMQGRRYSEGLHQAIEAKEGVRVQKESRTLATITFQNYFRIYDKLSGMTGTASTSSEEFAKVYKLDVMEIPTNQKMVRLDLPDVVYKTENGKFNAIVKKISELNKTGQPVLVGTIAIEKSEYLSELLKREGIKHEVLNAKHHEKEASIITKAGQLGAVTIATNMAGRGTDIKLEDGVTKLGGLCIIGTERHEARRIDNQLRGRAGRQGDPGMSQFYVSLEDELMRRFGGDRLFRMMDTLGLPEDQPIQNAIISRTIESAQSKIEGFNFDIRKHVLEYDDVINKQREVIYKKRREILASSEAKTEIFEYLKDEVEKIVSVHCLEEESNWDIDCIFNELNQVYPLNDENKKHLLTIRDDKAKDELEKRGAIVDYLLDRAKNVYNLKEKDLDVNALRQIEKSIVLQTIDNFWMNHLDEIDYLRQGIGLRGYGQRDPLIEYKREAYGMFTQLMENIKNNIIRAIFHVKIISNNNQPEKKEELRYQGATDEVEQFGAAKKEETGKKQEEIKSQPIINQQNIGRNDPCSCGSGKKYKRCCGA